MINNVETLWLRATHSRAGTMARNGFDQSVPNRRRDLSFLACRGIPISLGIYEEPFGITLDYAINTLGGGVKGGKF